MQSLSVASMEFIASRSFATRSAQIRREGRERRTCDPSVAQSLEAAGRDDQALTDVLIQAFCNLHLRHFGDMGADILVVGRLLGGSPVGCTQVEWEKAIQARHFRDP